MIAAELEIKDTTESTTPASYLYLLLSIGRDGQLHTSIYDKRDDFNFHITNFPFLERVLLKVVGLDVGVDVNVDFTTKVTHTYAAFYEGA